MKCLFDETNATVYVQENRVINFRYMYNNPICKKTLTYIHIYNVDKYYYI